MYVFVCDSGTLVRHAGPGRSGSAAAADDDIDPRLKNFEPRMVELIISEVIVCLWLVV